MNHKITVVLLVLIWFGAIQAQPATKMPGSEGWIKIADPSFASHVSGDDRCLEIEQGWAVETVADKISIKRKNVSEMSHWAMNYFPNLPFLPGRMQKMIPVILKPNHPRNRLTTAGYRGLPVASGWISGYNYGEFGGGVFWISDNGKSARWLYNENPIGLMAVHGGVLILLGLRHFESHGRAVYLSAADLKPGATLPQPVDLGDAPISAITYRDTNMVGFLILTDNGIRELLADWGGKNYSERFNITTLQLSLSKFGANSIAISKDHTIAFSRNEDERIYIGLADHVIVLRWSPRMGFYSDHAPEETWYAHSSCVRREKCRCVPASEEEMKRIVQLP